MAKRLGPPREKWLRLDNTNHEQVGTALARCQGHIDWCSSQGMCHRGGDCFITPSERLTELQRLRERVAANFCDIRRSVLRMEIALGIHS